MCPPPHPICASSIQTVGSGKYEAPRGMIFKNWITVFELLRYFSVNTKQKLIFNLENFKKHLNKLRFWFWLRLKILGLGTPPSKRIHFVSICVLFSSNVTVVFFLSGCVMMKRKVVTFTVQTFGRSLYKR